MSSPIENQSRKILVVDDDPQSLKLVSKTLEFEGYQVRGANSGTEAVQEMAKWRPHLVLLDVSMPGLDGLETLKHLREQDEYVSMVFLSGKTNTEDVVRGLDAGADDYIGKPFAVLELLSRVRTQLRIKDLNDNLKRANNRLKELVDIDDLTGLFNMRSLYKKLDFELDRARRYKRSLGVIMMDMDHFKGVNDGHDHLFGSFVLSEVGALIRENIRKVDFAARYGGDEFLIVLTETDHEGSLAFAERLRKRIEAYLFKSESFSMRLTSSMGLAITGPQNTNIDARSLVRYADRGLYLAKEKGRNRVENYPIPQASHNFSDEIQRDLRRKTK